METKNCHQCLAAFNRGSSLSKRTWRELTRFCSLRCAAKFNARNRIPPSQKGAKVSEANKQLHRNMWLGANNPRWVEDRSQLVRHEKKHLDVQYRIWSRGVKNRDGWKCKIANGVCKGRLEAHHILRWSEFPELRYDINNGITLCHVHHPRKRAEEKRLQSEFQALVSVSKTTL